MEQKCLDCRVLLSDQEPLFCARFGAALEAEGFAVHTCPRNGSLLLQRAVDLRPDIVVMNAAMAQLDALEVLARLHDGRLDPLPFLAVLLPVSSARLELELMAAGADLCFMQPFSEELAAKRLRQLCRRDSRPQPIKGSQAYALEEQLRRLGAPPNLKGYLYLRDAILLVMEDRRYLNALTGRLYPAVAQLHQSSPSAVERALRLVLEALWQRGDRRELGRFFPYLTEIPGRRPSAGEFIAALADHFSYQSHLKA